MSIFNFRRGRPANGMAAAQSAPESVEVVRKRARHRLIGSSVLVLVGVIGFPLLFETQPRPVPVDIAVEIPSRTSLKPAAPIEPIVRQEPAASKVNEVPSAAPAGPASEASDSVKPTEAAKAAEAPKASPEPVKPEPNKPSETAKSPAEAAKPAAEAKHKSEEADRAKALLEGASAPSENRIVVQVGAFADDAKAREVRNRLEKAGLKTYTQVTETKEGKRIRVRLGPFATKAEAEKAASQVKSLNLPAAVLTL